MFQANELIMFIISSTVVLYIFFHRRKIGKILNSHLLYLSFGFFFFSTAFTLAESFFLAVILNYLEHFFYLCSAFFLFLWTVKLAGQLRNRQ